MLFVWSFEWLTRNIFWFYPIFHGDALFRRKHVLSGKFGSADEFLSYFENFIYRTSKRFRIDLEWWKFGACNLTHPLSRVYSLNTKNPTHRFSMDNLSASQHIRETAPCIQTAEVKPCRYVLGFTGTKCSISKETFLTLFFLAAA